MKHFLRFGLIIFLAPFNLLAQNDSVWRQKPDLSISGFADTYYVYDFNGPKGNSRQGFLFNHNRHNEFNLNLGLISLDLSHAKYRGNISLQTGTYANDNYAVEPDLLKAIYGASVGISLCKRNRLWLDAGVLGSHIGFESAVSMDNLTLTRSLPAENSPYFLTGAMLTFNPNEKWQFAAVVANGWQRIQRLAGNSLPSFGTQVNFSPSENVTLNWSTLIGSEFPDSTRRMRYFNNFYGLFQLSESVNLITGFDIGAQQSEKGNSDYDIWFTPVVIGQFAFTDKWKTAVRAEFYHDETGIIISTGTMNGFQTLGLSLNLDYAPAPNVMCRVEGRWLKSEDEIFLKEGHPTDSNFIIGTSLAIKFVKD